jgi:DNA-binding NarL/FixJ family response regulator
MSAILLVEDHMGFAKAIQQFLARQTGFEIVGVVPSGEEALKQLRERKVDLVLVDVSLSPPINGIDLVQQILREFPSIRCLMLSGHLVPKYVKRSMEAGAYGYVLKDDVNGIQEGIRRVLDGEIYVSPALDGYEEG